MVDSVRIAIPLSAVETSIVRKSTRVVTGQAGYISYGLSIEKSARLNKLKIETRGKETNLIIECSVPVFLYGNNVAEVSDRDVIVFCERVSSAVNVRLSIDLTADRVLKAVVRRIHYGKNVIMPNTEAIHEVLDYASRSDVRANRSISSIKYQDGNSFHLRTSSNDVTLYDKSAENMKKRGANQHPFSSSCSILRVEVRLNNKRIISKFCPTEELTVEGLFKNDVARRVVLSALGMITDVAHYGDDSAYAAALANEKAKTPLDFLASIGLNHLINELGVPATKHLLKQKFGSHVWSRYRRFANKTPAIDAVDHLLQEVEQWEQVPP